MGDWTSLTYIFSQIIVILTYLCFSFTYFVKKRSLLLLTVMLANALQGIAFSLLSAWVGLGMCGVAICRDLTSYFINKKRSEETKNRINGLDFGLLFLWIAALVLITVFTYADIWSWFALLATMTFTVSIWQKNVLVYRIMGIFASAFWIVYDIRIENLLGIILEGCMFAVAICGVILYLVKMKRKSIAVSKEESTII